MSDENKLESKLTTINLGLYPYRDAWSIQLEKFHTLVEKKKHHKPIEEEWILSVEHPAVITMGKHAHAENLLLDSSGLAARGVECIQIERGGDITYHGPGQLVVYPIIDLEKRRIGVKEYVNIIEESVIRTLSEYGLKGERIEGASGVWIGKCTLQERKICALGVKISRYITMHGLALNVNTDMTGFSMINPCGFIDKGVTSIEIELGKKVDMEEVNKKLINHFTKLISTH